MSIVGGTRLIMPVSPTFHTVSQPQAANSVLLADWAAARGRQGCRVAFAPVTFAPPLRRGRLRTNPRQVPEL